MRSITTYTSTNCFSAQIQLPHWVKLRIVLVFLFCFLKKKDLYLILRMVAFIPDLKICIPESLPYFSVDLIKNATSPHCSANIILKKNTGSTDVTYMCQCFCSRLHFSWFLSFSASLNLYCPNLFFPVCFSRQTGEAKNSPQDMPSNVGRTLSCSKYSGYTWNDQREREMEK